MLSGKQGNGAQKQSPVLVIVLVVVIAAAGFMVFRTMSGGRPEATPGGVGPIVGPGMPGGPPGMPPGTAPGMAPGGAPGTAPGAPGAPGEQPPAQPQPGPGAAAPAQPAPSGPQAAAPAPKPAPTEPAPGPRGSVTPSAKPTPQEAMRQINVFGKVSVSYPATWKISTAGGNAAAVFTNGKAFFEVRPPDPRATSAQAIAQSALKTLGGGARVTSQGAAKIGSHDAYWMAVSYSGGTARIVGVDAPTRVVLLQRVKGGSFASYRDTFDKMQSGMRFGG